MHLFSAARVCKVASVQLLAVAASACVSTHMGAPRPRPRTVFVNNARTSSLEASPSASERTSCSLSSSRATSARLTAPHRSACSSQLLAIN